MSRTEQPWSVPVSVDNVPAAGLRVELHADAGTRLAVARAAGVNGLARLEATFDLARQGRDGLRVVGTVSGTVEQTCVVSLEPLVNDVTEGIELIFSLHTQRGLEPGSTGSDLNFAVEDSPEPLIDGTIDLGAVATEFLILGIDPYPRKPGVVFQAPDDSKSSNRAFAALATLKQKPSRE